MTDVIGQEIYGRKPLTLDPTSAYVVKRDVRRIDIDAPAVNVAHAFHDVLKKPGNRFGLIEILRTADKVGQPFSVGERFQGRFDIADAVVAGLASSFLSGLGSAVSKAFDATTLDEKLAGQLASDFGEITRLELPVKDAPDGPPGIPVATVAYRYLEGTPIAGSSTFTIAPLNAGTSRFTQVFVYQEQNAFVAQFMAGDGLTMHNEVVRQEMKQTAALLGATILASDLDDPER